MEQKRRERMARMLQSCIAGRTRLLNRLISGIFDDALRPVGMRNGQLTMLCMVGYLGRVKPHELQPLLQMDASTISRNLKRLKKKGWVKTAPAEDDRSHYVMLEPAGLEQVERAMPFWERAQERAEESLGAEGAESLNQASQAILDEIVRQAPEPGKR